MIKEYCPMCDHAIPDQHTDRCPCCHTKITDGAEKFLKPASTGLYFFKELAFFAGLATIGLSLYLFFYGGPWALILTPGLLGVLLSTLSLILGFQAKHDRDTRRIIYLLILQKNSLKKRKAEQIDEK